MHLARAVVARQENDIKIEHSGEGMRTMGSFRCKRQMLKTQGAAALEVPLSHFIVVPALMIEP